eukprot:GHUV01000020.1.p1 GENE.GHUV01000020.1~~GHUV01000020.1.p1  ORF type:complete len:165 (+),score=44.87 GHUV01000020.1:148-642(+)
MAAFTTMRATARPAAPVASSRQIKTAIKPARAFVAAPRFFEPSAASRLIVKGAGEPAAAAEEEKDPYDVPQTGRTAPMSEDKHADTPEQMAAPEGDRAILGQKWQTMEPKDGPKTPAERYGSEEKYQEAMEASKDRSRKSELGSGDSDSNTSAGGGNAGEGSSA